MSDIIKYFRMEAAELLETMQRSSLALEKESDRSGPLNELKRAAHSLKGSARLVDYFDLGDAAHEVEDYLDNLHAQKLEPTEEQISNLLSQVDQLEILLESVVAESQGTEQVVEEESAKITRDDNRQAQALAPPGEPEPTKDSIEDGLDELARVPSDSLDEIGLCSGKLVELSSRAKEWSAQLHKLRRALAKVSSDVNQEFGSADSTTDDSLGHNDSRITTRKNIRDQLATLMSSSESLQEIENGLDLFNPLSRQLNHVSLSLRLVPAEKEAYRFEKIVRAAAVDLGLETHFVLNGGKTKIDRKVLQKFTEPLGHLLRNAVAHGIESPSDRMAKGKQAAGTISLSFEKRGEFLRVVIEDDGRGIDVDSIRAKALAISDASLTAEVESMSAEQLRSLIFRSGFTTAREVTQIAGRGVGLDVVWEEVQRLRGSITVESEQDQFCRFIVNLPTNLDVLETMSLGTSQQKFLVPMSNVSTTLLVTADKIVRHAGGDAIVLDSTPISLHSLTTLLSLDSHISTKSKNGFYEVVVLRSQEGRFALVVDSLSGKQPVVVRSVGPILKANALLNGGTVMSDGQPAFLLNVARLHDIARNRQTSKIDFESTQDPTTVAAVPSILVVDDSLTTRMLEKSLLEAAGYNTVLASDGMQAISILKERSFDLLIFDFEMPGMNGIELTERVREYPQYEHVPIIMLTSIASDENKRKGLAAGVQAYLIKGVFDQHEFLETVGRLIGRLEDAA